eukprot:8607689-Ditylum_brightwellii.AAC.1
MQPLNKDELLNILEFGVPGSWCREFTVQGFDPMDQGLHKLVEFCTCLESCEQRDDKSKVEKTQKTRERKCKAKVSTMPTITTATTQGMKFYCKMRRPNRTHSTKDCFELKQRAKRVKTDMNRGGAD